jgi:hypothetical protein
VCGGANDDFVEKILICTTTLSCVLIKNQEPGSAGILPVIGGRGRPRSSNQEPRTRNSEPNPLTPNQARGVRNATEGCGHRRSPVHDHPRIVANRLPGALEQTNNRKHRNSLHLNFCSEWSLTWGPLHIKRVEGGCCFMN